MLDRACGRGSGAYRCAEELGASPHTISLRKQGEGRKLLNLAESNRVLTEWDPSRSPRVVQSLWRPIGVADKGIAATLARSESGRIAICQPRFPAAATTQTFATTDSTTSN